MVKLGITRGFSCIQCDLDCFALNYLAIFWFCLIQIIDTRSDDIKCDEIEFYVDIFLRIL